ncbi:hypothetical protein BY458DRAFT_553750 [Sporodiniella umbellata]|nr:hypothetical protein BY458DRAFT_553750 [Sporodiniella umbellata]
MQTANNNNVQTTLLTLQDAINDSPVYRSSSLHFDEQLDLLEKWLDALSKQMKQYTEKMNKFNLETNTLCKKVIPVGIDGIIIDPNFTGAVFKSFSDALQTSLAFKTKLVSDLEDNFIQPLQSFIKVQLKEFKDFKKQYEKCLERYESQLLKYTSQSRAKEASAIREEAFRLYETRKSYVRMSGQHVVRVLHFRSLLEHFLVEKFTLATLYHLKDFGGGLDSWSKIESSLASWKQWLIDDRDTCNYQLHQLQNSRNVLESNYLDSIRPPRDLEKYANSNQGGKRTLDHAPSSKSNSHKWGYLFARGSRNNWFRRWFFLSDGCFGTCHITGNRAKGSISIGDRVSVLLCDIKPIADIDRRFCFEVVCAHQPSFVLQAETEEEMLEWIDTFEKSKLLMLQNEDFKKPSSSPENNSTFDLDQEDVTVDTNVKRPSVVLLSSSPEAENEPSNSLTPLLVYEAAHTSKTANGNTSSLSLSLEANIPSSPNASTTTASPATTNAASAANNSSWGIPWTLVPNMFYSNEDNTSEIPSSFASTSNMTDSEGNHVVWPIKADDSMAPRVDLIGYSADMDSCNKELRKIFGGVGQKEVVLTTFVGLLKKKPTKKIEQLPEVPPSPTVINQSVDQLEQEFTSQIPANVKEPTSSFGYAYTGKGYITQETFWFHSCVMLNCVNTVAVRLVDIKAVRTIRDNSIANDGTNSNRALAIDLVTGSGNNEPLIFTSLMENIEVLSEKLKFAIEDAKSPTPSPIQITYDTIHALSASKLKNNNQVKQIIKSSATEPTLSSSSLLPLPEPTKSSDPKKKASTPRKFSAPLKPKSGALAAAMMAATVAGGSGFFDAKKELQEEYQNMLKKKPRSSSNPIAESLPIETPTKVVTEQVKIIKPNDVNALPSDFKAPLEPVSCKCDNHLDKLDSEIELPVSAKALYGMLFDDENPNHMDIWEQKTAGNKSKDLTMTKWEKGIDGKLERTLKYTIPVNNAMVKLKEAEAIEKQIIDKKEDYLCYVVTTHTKTPQLPYCDAFVPYLKYCITWVSQDRCKLACHIGVKFLKSIMVKGIVNKAAMKGMSENLEVFIPIIQDNTNRGSSKSHGTHQEKSVQEVTLKRGGTIRKSSTTAASKEAAPSSGWYDDYVEPVVQTARDVVEGLPFAVKASVSAIVVLWFLYSWLFRAGSRTAANTHDKPQVISRSVYLKDIDEGLLRTDIKSAYEHSQSFQLFLESNPRNQTLRDFRHNWYSSRHRQLAIDLLFSRERIAMLRHDVLVLFQLVNDVDAHLLENEYTNWLMDTRLQCLSSETHYDEARCADINRQLVSFPLKSLRP